MLVENISDQRAASPVLCGVLSSCHPAALEHPAVYMFFNAESSSAAEEGRRWIKATRILTMFQFRPTTRRFSMFMFVCCWQRPLEWNDVGPSGNCGIFSSSALTFPKPPLMLPETPSLD